MLTAHAACVGTKVACAAKRSNHKKHFLSPAGHDQCGDERDDGHCDHRDGGDTSFRFHNCVVF